jgi:hypothetical protein
MAMSSGMATIAASASFVGDDSFLTREAIVKFISGTPGLELARDVRKRGRGQGKPSSGFHPTAW